MNLPAKYTEPLPVPAQAELEDLYLGKMMSTAALSKHYGASTATIHKWLHGYEIPMRPIGTNAKMKKVGGRWLRQCTGPLHPEGEWLPLEKFHTYKKRGRVSMRATCKRCDDATGKFRPRIAFDAKKQAWLESIVNRIGLAEACRRLGISGRTMRTWRGRDPQRMRPKSLERKSMLALVTLMRELRETGEVRHRLSIRSGGARRGFPERVPTSQRDLYRPHGDQDTEARRRHRKLTGR